MLVESQKEQWNQRKNHISFAYFLQINLEIAFSCNPVTRPRNLHGLNFWSLLTKFSFKVFTWNFQSFFGKYWNFGKTYWNFPSFSFFEKKFPLDNWFGKQKKYFWQKAKHRTDFCKICPKQFFLLSEPNVEGNFARKMRNLESPRR